MVYCIVTIGSLYSYHCFLDKLFIWNVDVVIVTLLSINVERKYGEIENLLTNC